MLGTLTYKRLLVELSVTAAIAVVLSLLFGHFLLFLFLVTLGLLCWHYYYLVKLSHWIWNENTLFPPEVRGNWLPIFHGLRLMRKRQREQRNQLSLLLKQFRQGAESVPDGIILCKREGHLVWCNQLAQDLLGLKWPKDNQQSILNLIRLPEFVAYFKSDQFEQPATFFINQKRYVEFRIVYPYVADTLLIVARDVTEYRKNESMRQDFFANVSHELRIPLTVLQGYIELLSQDVMQETTEYTALESMQEQVSRLNNLVAQLTTLARIEAMVKVDFNTEINVQQFMNSIQKEAEAFLQKGQTLNITIDPTLHIYADESQLRSAITNLLFNAIEHTPSNSSITLNWQKNDKGEAVLSVCDSGQGIAPEHIMRLTERFYRVDSSRSRKTGGSGLGLAIVKHALNNHDSVLEIKSTLGQGSCFQFTLKGKWIGQ
ncbi:phosphate regulon sensor histidine kinase PhoR [Neisseria sp. Ec49-e6-T10]|uniref:phosphate regulon sensor histidine kinase PhoR n=1 Tax=Neisseria sp. Ec49-e6-T10 TaxID=3140744 RepID=UPI003EB7475D